MSDDKIYSLSLLAVAVVAVPFVLTAMVFVRCYDLVLEKRGVYETGADRSIAML